MSVQFKSVKIQNVNGIDVILDIEAPIGKPFGSSNTIPGGSTKEIKIGVSDCPSVLLAVRDAAHGTTRQTFGFSWPNASEGRPMYLESVDVIYHIGDFQGTAQGRTS